MRKKKVLFPLLAILSVLSLGIVDGGAQATPKRGGMITVGMSTDVVGVDPHTTSAAITAAVMNHCFERLVGYGETLELVPVLAERWEVPADLKTYTFHLRKGKLFHNGREMVAADVKYSIERIMDPKTGNPRRSTLQNIERIEAVDKYTVRMHMKKPDASLLSALAYPTPIMAVVPREEVEKQGGVMKPDPTSSWNGNPTGTSSWNGLTPTNPSPGPSTASAASGSPTWTRSNSSPSPKNRWPPWPS
jgi:ABC-type transport system substrate-binding protein